jgi:glycosyltransferase involved in cell wall biosynthesis
MNPLVSTVIPTHKRQELVQRAVLSVLRQTYRNIEVIVVIDGPEEGTVEILEALQEPRLRVIQLEKNAGLSGARNIGIRAARGEWVGLLDDDDEWLPEKVAKQLDLLNPEDAVTNFIGCRMRYVEIFLNQALPVRFPDPAENLSEYLYCHRNCLYPSTFLIKRDLMLARPFSETLRVNEDCDWLLRAKADGVFWPKWEAEGLVIIHDDIHRPRHHEKSNWSAGFQWAVANRDTLLTRKAFSYCILMLCVIMVRRSGHAIRDSLYLLYIAVFKGRIDSRFCAFFAVYVLLSNDTRRRLRLLNEWVKIRISRVLGRSSLAEIRG